MKSRMPCRLSLLFNPNTEDTSYDVGTRAENGK
jgi:hypothetical protein